MARDMIRYGQPLEDCLPAAILPLLREMRQEGKEHGKRAGWGAPH